MISDRRSRKIFQGLLKEGAYASLLPLQNLGLSTKLNSEKKAIYQRHFYGQLIFYTACRLRSEK